MILPELGGRIQRAYDKTNNYDFVYYNKVIKPALVGLVGPWISGGIEFNWPQHHRPTTYMPVDYVIQDNKDGSKTLLVNDVDQMYGTKGIAKFTLYPDKSYIEITGQLYNRTSLPQTFLWWANPAVAVIVSVIYKYIKKVQQVLTDDKNIARIFKALCDENRIKIIKLLCSGEKCACKLLEEINVSQPTLSHHMKILCDSGIVNSRKDGKWMHYSISENGSKMAKECLNNILK